MIVETNKILGAKVQQEDTGETLALLNLPIIDPDTGVVEAFWVKPAALAIDDAILQTSNILSFKKNIYIKDVNVIAEPQDVLRIADILEDGRLFTGSVVKNESGKRYGKVNSVSFSTDTYVLKNIYTSRALGLDKRVFPYERVVKVLPGEVIIDDDTTGKETVKNAEPA